MKTLAEYVAEQGLGILNHTAGNTDIFERINRSGPSWLSSSTSTTRTYPLRAISPSAPSAPHVDRDDP